MSNSAPKILVTPSNLEFEVTAGQTVLDAANSHDISWPTVCEGNATCTRCFMEVIDGLELLSPMQETEREALDNIRWRGTPRENERLACCTEIYGDIVVRRRGVRLRKGNEMENSA